MTTSRTLASYQNPTEHVVLGIRHAQALQRPIKAAAAREVMVIQIRAFPPFSSKASPRRGWLYQAVAPLDTILGVRTAGQYAHNHDEFALLQEAVRPWAKIYTAVFEYCEPEAPLSWHLDAGDIERLKTQWGSGSIRHEWTKIERFLDGKSKDEDILEPALDSLCIGDNLRRP
jgi:hypothetical protein